MTILEKNQAFFFISLNKNEKTLEITLKNQDVFI